MNDLSNELLSLGDSLDSLRQRLPLTDDRQHRVLAAELRAYSNAQSGRQGNDVLLKRLQSATLLVAACKAPFGNHFDDVMAKVESVLDDIEAS